MSLAVYNSTDIVGTVVLVVLVGPTRTTFFSMVFDEHDSQ
jgi:hypothetical protein